MAQNKFRKKPTIREIANVTIELNQRINSIMHLLSELEKAFSLYVEMNKDVDKFSEFIEERIKEMKESQNDTEGNEGTDKQDIPTDTEDSGSGSEGIRKEK
tara:strand:+ start:5290 stop:5592 length:303 start_codon:yes stop_codon:yes gene_type:complete